MTDAGPMLELLLDRLAACPADFLEPSGATSPIPGVDPRVRLQALVGDLLRLGLTEGDLLPVLRQLPAEPSSHRGLLAVVAWLLADDWFRTQPEMIRCFPRVFASGQLTDLAAIVPVEQFVGDPDRREELVRVCLQHLGLRPAGESDAQSADRLTVLDSVERRRVLKATAEAERRAREVREAMELARAREAASRYGE
jgi:hypothetical protein